MSNIQTTQVQVIASATDAGLQGALNAALATIPRKNVIDVKYSISSIAGPTNLYTALIWYLDYNG